MTVVSDSHHQSTLDAVYVDVVPWSEFPITRLGHLYMAPYNKVEESFDLQVMLPRPPAHEFLVKINIGAFEYASTSISKWNINLKQFR